MKSTTKPKPVSPPRYGRPTLRDRGWTDALIRRFLPSPDATAPNPHYRSGPPRLLYDVARVGAIEASQEWQAARRRAGKRQWAAAQAIETKIEKLKRDLARIAIPPLPTWDAETLTRRACDHYNRRQLERAMDFAERGREYDYRDATPDSDPAFLARITVNYCRHALSTYECNLETVAGRVGVTMARVEIARKVFEAIGEAYPWLKEECERQLAERETPCSP
jgi:hypothetical protein